jgi:hypothetical protein
VDALSSRALFWACALVVCPALGIFAALAVTGIGSDVLAWALLLGLPPFATLFLAFPLGRRRLEAVVAGALSAGVSVLGVVVFLWWALSVNGLS